MYRSCCGVFRDSTHRKVMLLALLISCYYDNDDDDDGYDYDYYLSLWCQSTFMALSFIIVQDWVLQRCSLLLSSKPYFEVFLANEHG